jgi:folate-binding protein YgfZ
VSPQSGEFSTSDSLPLIDLYKVLGATFDPDVESARVPVHYGSPADEYARLRQECGLADSSGVARILVDGEDGQRFINGMVTCDVQSLAPGGGAYGFFTDRLGHVLADVRVRMAEENLWLEVPLGGAEGIVHHLEKYIIADRVELKRAEDCLALTLVGARARDLLAELVPGEELPSAPWSHGQVDLLGRRMRIAADQCWGLPAFTLWAAADRAPSFVKELVAVDGSVDLGLVGQEAVEMVRLEAGIPRFGRDFDSRNLPQETGLEEAVSYDKGCYLGQEVVARLHYRGQASKLMRGVVLDTDKLPAVGVALLADGREAGRLTTVGRSPQLSRAIGLSILQRRATEPGTRVVVEATGEEGEVVALPFVEDVSRSPGKEC